MGSVQVRNVRKVYQRDAQEVPVRLKRIVHFDLWNITVSPECLLS